MPGLTADGRHDRLTVDRQQTADSRQTDRQTDRDRLTDKDTTRYLRAMGVYIKSINPGLDHQVSLALLSDGSQH